ncbi:class I adenylate-forming enzyme family protein [Gymnodinialimonas sp. 57CJ19]|uniref:class I adenylate-forming enzyme family protein n=1 Tax=Gymnodinialimonas sp. 57CJ19 TaxID=3138498 RepID=UPI003134496A
MNTQLQTEAPLDDGARLLFDLFERNCRAYPDAECLVDPSDRSRIAEGVPQRLTWAQISQRVDRMALTLVDHKVGKGDVVLSVAPTLHETLVVQLACLRLGVILAQVPVQYREAEIASFTDRLRPRVLIGHKRLGKHAHAAMLRQIANAHDAPVTVMAYGGDVPDGVVDLDANAALALDEQEAARLDAAIVRADMQPDDDAFIVFTSGTSAAPKAIPRTQQDLFDMRTFLTDAARLSVGGGFLCPRMLNTIGAVANGIASWLYSSARIILHHPFDIEVFLEQIAQEKPEVTSCPPAILTTMLQRIDAGAEVDLSSLHHITTGSAQLNPQLMIDFRDRFGIALVNVFGSSEGVMLLASEDDIPDAEDRAHYFPRLGNGPCPSTLGILANYQTRLVDPATEREVHSADVIGELRVKCQTILRHYWDDPKGTQDAFDADGWFRTGDLFAYAGDNCAYLRFVGRLKHIIVRGGLNISAEEVQAFVQSHPAVSEVVAVAVPDDKMGEKVGVAVTLRPGASLTLPDLCDHLKTEAKIAVFKLPEHLRVLDALPVLPSGKTDPSAVRALFAPQADNG